MSTIATLRDISAVLIALEVFVMLLIPLAIAYLMVKGMLWVNRKLRVAGALGRRYFRQAADLTDKASQAVVAPIIAVDAFAAQLRRIWSAL